ncbi:MAG: peroxiredoxin family protein [Gemmatimonadetes bacterium]|nr:peroxiredoxin family protein [Gemmatimonadota bacterium]
MPRLENGQKFPSQQLPAVGGSTLSLPEDLTGSFAVVLVYRGAWCPYCNGQLRAFTRAQESLESAGLKVVALSVDDEQTSTQLVEKLRLNFPVAYNADPDEVAATLGSYVNDDPRYLQSTGFVLAPDGTVVTAVYSSGAIGRLLPEDVVGLVRYIQEHASDTGSSADAKAT